MLGTVCERAQLTVRCKAPHCASQPLGLLFILLLHIFKATRKGGVLLEPIRQNQEWHTQAFLLRWTLRQMYGRAAGNARNLCLLSMAPFPEDAQNSPLRPWLVKVADTQKTKYISGQGQGVQQRYCKYLA